LLGLVAKIGFEMLTRSAIFVDASSAGFQPVPLAHVIGALVGALVCFCPASTVGEKEPSACQTIALPVSRTREFEKPHVPFARTALE